jgi:hypothetical protein
MDDALHVGARPAAGDEEIGLSAGIRKGGMNSYVVAESSIEGVGV